MPVLVHDGLEIEHSDSGDGPAVVLIHCSVSGIRQWRSLTEELADRYRVRALNLYGYGATTPWPEREMQTLEAQAQLVVAACEGSTAPSKRCCCGAISASASGSQGRGRRSATSA